MGTFDQRMRDLEEQVGSGRLTGAVEVDQVYAHYQHAGLDLHHPRGGQAEYLREPLFTGIQGYYRRLAGATLDPDGLHRAMAENVEDLALEVSVKAPVEWEDLRKSAHPQVRDGADTVYDRPPEVHRLTEDELRAKHRRGLPAV